MLGDVVDLLACPHCGRPLALGSAAEGLRCPGGHHFDVARQGYVSLLAPGAEAGAGDTAEMVKAREELLCSALFAPLQQALVARAEQLLSARSGTLTGSPSPDSRPAIVDVGAGPGVYLAALLGGHARWRGLAVDLSRFAARRAARAHPRAGALVADARLPLPIRDAAADLVLSVFAPRNGAELRRILRPDGALLVVSPTPAHLAELVGRLDLLRVDARKAERLGQQLAGHFALVDETPLEFPLALGAEDARRLVAMGPNAFHLSPAEIDQAVATLPVPFLATGSVAIASYRPRT